MKRLTLMIPILMILSCQQNTKKTTTENQVMVDDPHSFSKPSIAYVTHLDLDLKVNFEQQQITGKAIWTIDNKAKAKEIIFDDSKLNIEKITLGADEKETTFTFGSETAYLGKALKVAIAPETKLINIYYTTGKDASALQWLNPQQTAGKKRPYLFTQSESIAARSWVPCQDSPGIRFTYNATVKVPADLLALMSAENPQAKNSTGIYQFKQVHPIPSYLLALAVGDIAFKAVDERTGVYAEPSVLEKAAWEFADMGKMVHAAEKLYGPYRWGRYDLVVLPPSFPFGGMENPNLTFITPTILAGDRSLVSIICHELAHSWSGNLVTNATWNDFWLNEGFTNYFERRMDEELYGKNEAEMQEVFAKQALENAVKDMGADSKDTYLKTDYTGRNPDEGTNDIAYEKGFFFLKTIEAAVGREKFDAFLRGYFDGHAFQSLTTEQFLDYLNKNLIKGDKALEDKIDINKWVYGPGIPANVAAVGSARFKAIDGLVANWRKTAAVKGLSKEIVSSNERRYFISQLPANLTAKDMAALDAEFGFTASNNTDIQLTWYELALRHHYTTADARIKAYLLENGRMWHIIPLYKEMMATPEGLKSAREIYKLARPNYHPMTYQAIDKLLK
ncbi:M1 family metallopeptidase [Pedobacter hiemivivus]|uniref:Aminopeptidase N n=1 Tax=Pedobacter hiemivivus TaxID=2530454 RepID=A0A4U1G1X4_9SPHI|nr:M1 family metallopeptidase [Pedobacter hiemivivus]TKC57551.1 M1 family metallopeptidase [Pedobacter hiemivivus]